MWRGEETDRAEEINALWRFDYGEMGKRQHGYNRYWDACFFGIALKDCRAVPRLNARPVRMTGGRQTGYREVCWTLT